MGLRIDGTAAAHTLALSMRPVQRNDRGAWVGGNASWNYIRNGFLRGVDPAVRQWFTTLDALRATSPHGYGYLSTGDWISLDDAVDSVLAGRLHNPSAVVGILAAAAARASGFEGLRPADAPWPAHPSQR